jgi:hypothetical protein
MLRIGEEALRYMIEKYLEEQGLDFDINFRIYAVKGYRQPILHPSLEIVFDESE